MNALHNAIVRREERIAAETGPRGIKLGDYEHPVFDGPQPRDRPALPHGMQLNTENAGE